MNIRRFQRILASAAAIAAIAGMTSCGEEKFHVEGTIAEATDSILYFENMSLSGPVVKDSVKLGADGSFAFSGSRSDAPEFYRLRIGGQIINVAVDSTETINVKASYPTMAFDYEVTGSDECAKIKELAQKQMALQYQANAIVADPTLGVDAVSDSLTAVVLAYKNDIKFNYIFKEPMRAYSYFALFQTISVMGTPSLIFNPRSSEDDVKVFAAVATSWDNMYPGAERGENLHNIAIEGMKNIRIVRNKNAATIDPDIIDMSGVLDINLKDNKGAMRRLSDLKGKVVLLDFHLFSGDGSKERIMMLRELYNKYHSAGFEIYQVSLDGDEHFWKLQTAALPWISVRLQSGDEDVLQRYNVQAIPTFFLLGKDVNVYKRDAQMKDVEQEIKALL